MNVGDEQHLGIPASSQQENMGMPLTSGRPGTKAVIQSYFRRGPPKIGLRWFQLVDNLND